MTHISDIDVNGINQNLRVRYCRDEIYTYTGTILVAVNPYKFLPIYETVSACPPLGRTRCCRTPRPAFRAQRALPLFLPG